MRKVILIIIKRDYFSSEEEEEKKKKDGTHVAKFQHKRGENFCMILGAHTQVNERALFSLSIALIKETTHEKTFFLCLVFFLFVGSRYFLVFSKNSFFYSKKQLKKNTLKRL